jgi:hypothetical protein
MADQLYQKSSQTSQACLPTFSSRFAISASDARAWCKVASGCLCSQALVCCRQLLLGKPTHCAHLSGIKRCPAGFALMLVAWARGGQLGKRGQVSSLCRDFGVCCDAFSCSLQASSQYLTPSCTGCLQGYQAILEFPLACGITVGTPVRIRGVPVGGVLSVQPSLEKVWHVWEECACRWCVRAFGTRCACEVAAVVCACVFQVDVLVEMRDSTTVIPRNSLIEANQSGLIAEPLIDITPQAPVPQYKGGYRSACMWGHVNYVTAAYA